MKEQAPPPIAGPPPAQGLYDPAHEHDACGVGFVVNIKGVRSHAIVRQALQVLINLLHRGACGCEANTGDGAGILLQMPDKFLRKECGRLGIPLPGPKDFGAGMVFLPRDPASRIACEYEIERAIKDEGQSLLGWRDVPVDNSDLAEPAKKLEPVIRQVFIGRGRRSRPARAKAGKVRAFRASPSCIARAVRILNPTVPTDRSAKPRSTWRLPWLKKS